MDGFEPNDQPLAWSSDQKYIYASANSGVLQTLTARVFRIEVATGHREGWKEFSLPDPTGVSGISARAITPDGKSFVFSFAQRFSDLYLVEGLK